MIAEGGGKWKIEGWFSSQVKDQGLLAVINQEGRIYCNKVKKNLRKEGKGGQKL